MESDAQLVSSEFPIGVRLGSDQETYLATESLSPCSSSEIQQWPTSVPFLTGKQVCRLCIAHSRPLSTIIAMSGFSRDTISDCLKSSLSLMDPAYRDDTKGDVPLSAGAIHAPSLLGGGGGGGG